MWRFFFSAFLLIWTARHGRPQRWVRNCGDYLERHCEESLTRWELVSPRYHAFAVVEPCELLKYLKWARPAARSFLRGGLFEGPLHDLLPADFGVSESCQQPIYDLGRDREMPIPSWRESVAEYGHEFEIEFVGDDQAKVSEDHYVLHVMDTLARADFNGDGFEDVLLLLVTLQAPDRGTGERIWRRYGHWQEVAILTRGTRWSVSDPPFADHRVLFSFQSEEVWSASGNDGGRPPPSLPVARSRAARALK